MITEPPYSTDFLLNNFVYPLEPTQRTVKYQVAPGSFLEMQIIDSTPDLLNHHLHVSQILW